MPVSEGDPYGAKDRETEYADQGRRRAGGGFARSAWAVAAIAVFLVGIFIWVATRPPGGTDPAPGGSPGTGVVRESGPATNNP
ncbi:MAG TPA: hypothetical protein VHG11_10925 [Pseudorhizobium sp.]|nr:hypothetical protein [Pseudorhizobium sp.]